MYTRCEIRQNGTVIQLVLAAFLLVLSQASTFQSDPPNKCDACDAWNKPREPFRLFGNSYYVGTDGLSAILITGDAGHVLLDGGLQQSAALIDANIRKLGFRTEDVKLIVNSHAHYDHAGGIAALQRASGATVAASPSGARALENGENTPDDPQYGFGRAANAYPPVKNVRVFADSEVQRVGNISITPNFSIGHTPGGTTWTWRSCEPPRPQVEAAMGERCLNLVYADSLSPVSAPGFRYTASPALVAQFRRTITRVAELPCDIIVSTHPEFTQIDAKLKRRAEQKGPGPDPFIDPQACRAYAAQAMKRLEARIADEAK